MSKPLALLFAIVGVALMCGISISISHKQPWFIFAFSAATIIHLGIGFTLKARLKKKNTNS